MLEHIPLVGVGKRLIKHFELPFIRYDSPGIPAARHLSLSSPISLHSAKLRAPILRYNLSTPTTHIGPGDLVSTCIYLHPIDPLVAVKSASLTIERRINLYHSTRNHPPPSPALDHVHSPYPSSSLDPYASTSGLLTPSASSSSATLTPAARNSFLPSADSDSNHTTRHLLPLQPVQSASSAIESSKTTTNVIVSTEAVNFSRDASGMWSKTISVQWPPRKKHSWATGETLTSDIAAVRFYIRIKVSENISCNAFTLLTLPAAALRLISPCWNRVD